MAITRWGKRLLVGTMIVIGIAALALAFVTTIFNVSSSITSDNQRLEEKALEWARINGLQGTPVAKRSVRMTFGQWLAFHGGGLGPGAEKFGLTSNTPVFVLAIRGKVERQDSQSPLQGQTRPVQFDNITVVVDVNNGTPLAVESLYDVSAMPIQVPLNALTPVAPIRYAPTQPPVTPPTLPSSATLTPTPIQSALPTPALPAQ